MIVIDDNNLKLLKMKEKLLEISTDNLDNILNDYRKLAIQLDSQIFNTIVNKIKNNSNYNNLSLEEQLKFLTELDEDYTYFNELQYRFKNTYEKYANDELKLSKIDDILIDNIRMKISSISGYLINIKNIEKNKRELDKLNLLLIEEDKKSNLLIDRLNNLEGKLKENILKVEGRVYDKDGNSVYTSIAKELNWQLLELLGDKVDDKDKLDLKELLNNKEVLKNEIEKATTDKDELEESLKAARICYENLSNINNREIYESIRIDTIKARYKLIVLSIVDRIANTQTEYNLAKEKRKELLRLIDDRIGCLNGLLSYYGFKYSNGEKGLFLYDPFDRIGIKEQLEDLDNLNNNKEYIKNIKRDINSLIQINDQMINNNHELFISINENIDLFNDHTTISSIISEENIVDEMNSDKKVETVTDNQVVSINDVNIGFMLDRVKEKTTGVINRVNEMFNGSLNVEQDNSSEVVPELIITENDSTKEKTNNDEYKEEKSNLELANSDIFLDIPITLDNGLDKKESASLEVTDVIDNPKVDSEIDKKVDDSLDIDLFQEVSTPFEATPLFNEKYDDGIKKQDDSLKIDLSNEEEKTGIISKIEEDTDELEKTMPDLFWTPIEEENNEKADMSFDERYNEQLLSFQNEENKSKTKKLVA